MPKINFNNYNGSTLDYLTAEANKHGTPVQKFAYQADRLFNGTSEASDAWVNDGGGLGIGSRGGAKLDPATVAYINAAAAQEPTAGEIRYIPAVDKFIKTLKAANLWGRFDCIYLANYEGIGSRINMVNPSVKAGVINNVTFGDKIGWVANDITSALDLSVNPTTTNNFKAGRGSLITYIHEPILSSFEGSINLIGSQASATTSRNWMARSTTTTRPFIGRLYTSNANIQQDIASLVGYCAISNNANLEYSLYNMLAKVSVSNSGYGSGSVFNGNFYGVSFNNNGEVLNSNIYGHQKFFAVGDFFTGGNSPTETGGEHAIIRDALNTYFTEIEAM